MAAPPSDEEREIARNRRTLYLVIGGVLSLLVPLLGALYLRMSDRSFMNAGGTGAIIFSRRAAGDKAPSLTPNMAAASVGIGRVTEAAPKMNSPMPVAAPESSARDGGDSLSFLRGGEDYYGDGSSQPPPPQQQEPASPPPAEPPTQAQAAAKAAPAAKAGPKPFAMPKLKPSSGFSDFKGGGRLSPGSGAPAGPNPAALQQQAAAAQAAGGQQPQSAWKPASGPGSGANLPALGQLGQKKGAAPPPGAPGAAPAMPAMPAMPDIGGLLQGAMPPGGLPKEAGGVKIPDVGGMLNSIPGMGADPKKK